MSTTAKAEKTASSPKTSSAQKSTDAIELLESDHREVEELFEEYEELDEDSEKKLVAAKICMALKVHAQIEEELFYPAARKAIKDKDLLDEALVEHASAKNLIAQIEAMEPGQDLYDAKVKVLGEQITHHVKDEEEELFPEVRESDIDLKALGVKMAKRKAELSGAITKNAA